MRQRVPLLASLFSLLAVLACARPPAESDMAARDKAIDSLYHEFSAAYDALDPDRVTALYAPDAVMGSPGAPGYGRGRAAILADFKSFFDAKRQAGETISIRFSFVERRRTPTLASDAGFFALTTRKGDSTRTGAGKFVTILAPDSAGTWRFVLDTYSDASVAAFEAAQALEP